MLWKRPELGSWIDDINKGFDAQETCRCVCVDAKTRRRFIVRD